MSIDDNEVHHARSIVDEIFGSRNFIASIVWEKDTLRKVQLNTYLQTTISFFSIPRMLISGNETFSPALKNKITGIRIQTMTLVVFGNLVVLMLVTSIAKVHTLLLLHLGELYLDLLRVLIGEFLKKNWKIWIGKDVYGGEKTVQMCLLSNVSYQRYGKVSFQEPFGLIQKLGIPKKLNKRLLKFFEMFQKFLPLRNPLV